MNPPTRSLIDDLLDWIDREIARAEDADAGRESETVPADEPQEREPRERLKVPSAIPA